MSSRRRHNCHKVWQVTESLTFKSPISLSQKRLCNLSPSTFFANWLNRSPQPHQRATSIHCYQTNSQPMEINIATFNFASLISHAHCFLPQVLINTLEAAIYCVSKTHLKTRNNGQFSWHNVVRNDNNTDAALLVIKDYYFEEVVIENLLTSSAAAAILKTADTRRILFISVSDAAPALSNLAKTW